MSNYSEKDLYAPIKDKLKGDYPEQFVLEQYPLLPPAVKPELLAFDWKGREIDTIAVECKLKEDINRSVREALGQAFFYRQFCHYVYVGTKAGSLKKETEELLKKLGIGHYSVDLGRGMCKESIRAERSRAKLFKKYLEPYIATFFAFNELCEKHQTGKFDIRKGAQVARTKGEPHLSAWTDGEIICLQSNVSRSGMVRKFYNINKRELCNLLSSTSEKVKLWVEERQVVKVKRKDVKFKKPIVNNKPVKSVSPRDFEKIVRKCKRMKGKAGSDLARIVFRERFEYESSRERCLEKIDEAWNDIKPIHTFLKEKL